MEFFTPYKNIVLIWGVIGLMSFIQLIIADLCSIKSKQTPGYPIEADHNSLLFRAVRAHANTNESIAIFILFSLFGIFSAANAQWLTNFAMAYLAGRVLHMVFYYTNTQLARSASFVLILIASYFFALPYMFAIIAKADNTGQLSVLSSAALAIGSMLGAYLYGVFMEFSGTNSAYVFSFITIVFGMILILKVEKKHD